MEIVPMPGMAGRDPIANRHDRPCRQSVLCRLRIARAGVLNRSPSENPGTLPPSGLQHVERLGRKPNEAAIHTFPVRAYQTAGAGAPEPLEVDIHEACAWASSGGLSLTIR